MRRLLLAAALGLLGARSWAASSSDAGTSAALFLGLGPGARAAALGEAYTAAVDEASAMYWNPAALSRVEKRSVQLMHGSYLGAADFEYLAFGHNLERWGAWGLSVQNVSAKAIPLTDASGVGGGTYSTDDTALSLGWAYTFGARDQAVAPAVAASTETPAASGSAWSGLSLGLAVKTISSRVASTARATAVDLGLLSPPLWRDRLRLSATAANLGSKIKFDRESESLPFTAKVGAALTPSPGWLASLDFAMPRHNSPYVAAGAERRFAASKEITAAGRLGFNSRALGDVGGFSGVSFGLGLGVGAWDFDYALVPFGSLGLAHRFSLTVKF